ncbi:hypothetical protein [Kytococcus sedentarius]|uniref:hypothetical protein n=1 Tax=Kytococcus sedentarius TaxID=1276 RepID=UPI0035BC0EDD
MARPIERNMGGEALRAATGRDHEGWRALLLGAGARDWDHARIARHLVEEHGVDGWWAQGITVDFEQTHQGRLPGQQKDGTFTAATTRTVPGDRLDALARVADGVSSRHGQPHGENLTASHPVVRWRLADGTRLAASALPLNASGTPVNLTWQKLPTADRVDTARAELLEILAEAAGG